MNASFFVRKLGERSRRFNSLSSFSSERTVPLADEVRRPSTAGFTKPLPSPKPNEPKPKSMTSRSSPRTLEGDGDKIIPGSLLVDFDNDDDESIGVEDIYCYSDELDEQGDGFDSPSSGAVSLESSLDLDGLAEFALVDLRGNGDANINDSFISLANFNAQNGSSRADFSSSPQPSPAKDTTASLDGASQSRARRSAESWARSRRRRKSWLDIEDLLYHQDDDDGGEDAADVGGSNKENEMLTAENEDNKEEQEETTIKMVRFRPLCRRLDVRPHISRSELSRSELNATWYDEYEHEEMQTGVVETLMILRRVQGAPDKKRHESEELCPRGLEHVIDEGLATRREKRKVEVIAAVMKEQLRRRGDNTNDKGDEAIAEASRYLSKEARRMATLIGKNDEAAARLVLRPQGYLGVHGIAARHRRGSLTPAAA